MSSSSYTRTHGDQEISCPEAPRKGMLQVYDAATNVWKHQPASAPLAETAPVRKRQLRIVDPNNGKVYNGETREWEE